MTSQTTPHITRMQVIPVAGRDGMLLNLSGAHGPFFTRNIVILTGAGVSAESGVATFRGPGGLWEGHRVEDVCTPQALAHDPVLVHRFYDERRAKLTTVAPNAAHHALARLDAEWPGELLLVTQNVDDLHERAGSKRLIHMHGELNSALCADCDARTAWTDSLPPRTRCATCGAPSLRPDIVFFGEMPYRMEAIDAAISRADLLEMCVGNSGDAGLTSACSAPKVKCSALSWHRPLRADV